ncbi:C-terminal novel E3 ligase, LRR-interacting [Pseudomonas sp. NFACC02]|uniref:NEL-type E3 ubiquitin ligase domain-containing protein n=1 Tax=Pseudomonas sp. NFACC02 TaxID=1566250 RepID=UPI0008CC3BF1|nr:C-terminal novel E3 ligase, LRR-interacting [Pseudomonas sp. NFACC02]
MPTSPDNLSNKAEQLRQQFAQDPVLQTLQAQLSPAFIQASASERKAYLEALRLSRTCKRELKKALAPLKGIDAFCKPLFAEALAARFGNRFHPTQDTFFGIALHGHADPSTVTHTLLEAAMHNFERGEAVTGGFDRFSLLGPDGLPHPETMKYDEFVDLTRGLNLGQKYQDHLKSILEPASRPGDGPDVGRQNMRGLFISNDRADMELYARAAVIKKQISPAFGAAMIDLAMSRPEPSLQGKPLVIQGLKLLDHGIARATLIHPARTWTFTQVPFILYIPQDPVCPMKEYASMEAIEDDLRTRLMDLDYQAFFAGLIGERNRAAFFERLNRHLFPLMPMDGNRFTTGLWERRPDHAAKLLIDFDVIEGNLFRSMFNQQMFLMKDNARFLVVPTEDEDALTRRKRLQAWLSLGLTLANVAALYVPLLGSALLVYAGAELVGDVYHGLEDLSHDDFEQGIDHLMSAAANLAFMTALAKAGEGERLPEPPPIKSNAFVGSVIPVKLSNGQTRLWKPDISPFQVDVVLPEHLSPDIDGVTTVEGRRFIQIDDRTYELHHETDLNKWALKHPHPGHPLSVPLQRNGVGAFRCPGEDPQQWGAEKLFKRLGHSAAGLDEAAARQILSVTGTDEALLREVHQRSAVPPGLLRDTLKRFQLDARVRAEQRAGLVSSPNERFTALYRESEKPTDPMVQLLQRDFSGLPLHVAEDIIADTSTAERQQIVATGRVALRHAEAAAWHLRQVRLTRALEGFHLKSVVNPDTDTLRFRLLAKLPGWSDTVRIELRDGSQNGPLLDSLGSVNAPELKILVRENGGYLAHDTQGNDLNSKPAGGDNLCDALLHALPDGLRQAIGVPHVWQADELNERLAQIAAADRAQSAALLGQTTQPLRFNLPRRMSKGRLGYGLSGRGQLPGFVLEDHLLDKIALLELADMNPHQALAALRRLHPDASSADLNQRLDVLLQERSALRSDLDAWALRSVELPDMSMLQANSRTWIGHSILQWWQAASFLSAPESAVLRISASSVVDFPERLPEFFFERVEQVSLSYMLPRDVQSAEYAEHIGLFLQRFERIRSLAVTNPSGIAPIGAPMNALPRVIAQSCPLLRDLDLSRQQLNISVSDFDHFRGLQHLRRLNLTGNSLDSLALTVRISPLNLDRLVLENTRLTRWPMWLNEWIPEHVGEVSLAHNRIYDLPDHVIHNMHDAARPTVIALEGNLLPRRTVIEACLYQARPRAAFRFDLYIPPQFRPTIDTLLRDQAEIEQTLADWVDAGGSAGQSQERLRGRIELRDGLLDQWRNNASGRVSLPLRLDAIHLDQFPSLLPDSFYQAFTSLDLRNVHASPDRLNALIRRFPHATAVDISGACVPPLLAPPAALLELPDLREVELSGHGMLIDQAAFDFFCRIPQLRHLDLSANRLSDVIDTQAIVSRRWESLTLEGMGLERIPAWLADLLPDHLYSLSLAENRLTELPPSLLANPRSHAARSEVVLTGNPLTRETLEAAHLSEGPDRPFSFYMDLPDDLMDIESDDDSTDDEEDLVDHWLFGNQDARAAQRAAWTAIETAGDARSFLNLIGRLRRSADFLRNRDALTSRVWSVLHAAADDAGLRVLLNGMAEEAITQRTCEDGVRLEFNQIEIQVFTRTSLRDIPDADRGRTLYRLMRRLYHLDALDRLARQNSGARDEAEVRMAYRVGLAQPLDLPLAPGNMLYREAAALGATELADVAAQVLQSETSAEFLQQASNCEFWRDWLREAHARDFNELKEVFARERDQLEDQFPELDQAYLDRAKALDDDQKRREAELISTLTTRVGLAYGD